MRQMSPWRPRSTARFKSAHRTVQRPAPIQTRWWRKFPARTEGTGDVGKPHNSYWVDVSVPGQAPDFRPCYPSAGKNIPRNPDIPGRRRADEGKAGNVGKHGNVSPRATQEDGKTFGGGATQIAFFAERAGIAEFDGALPRPQAEERAFTCGGRSRERTVLCHRLAPSSNQPRRTSGSSKASRVTHHA